MSASNGKKSVRNKVLVTGASGLLGVAAIEKFLAAGWDVVGVSRRKLIAGKLKTEISKRSFRNSAKLDDLQSSWQPCRKAPVSLDPIESMEGYWTAFRNSK
jgi:NAD(P)-dependent dehydrogenase (short-subunit alcohol dehydrogenase family)